MARRPYWALGLLIVEVSRSNSDTPHSVGLLRTNDRPIAETSTCTTQNAHKETDSHAPGGIRTRKLQQASSRRPTP
jgi:hypothetical protein